jgi:hypothetical protein
METDMSDDTTAARIHADALHKIAELEDALAAERAKVEDTDMSDTEIKTDAYRFTWSASRCNSYSEFNASTCINILCDEVDRLRSALAAERAKVEAEKLRADEAHAELAGFPDMQAMMEKLRAKLAAAEEVQELFKATGKAYVNLMSKVQKAVQSQDPTNALMEALDSFGDWATTLYEGKTLAQHCAALSRQEGTP